MTKKLLSEKITHGVSNLIDKDALRLTNLTDFPKVQLIENELAAEPIDDVERAMTYVRDAYPVVSDVGYLAKINQREDTDIEVDSRITDIAVRYIQVWWSAYFKVDESNRKSALPDVDLASKIQSVTNMVEVEALDLSLIYNWTEGYYVSLSQVGEALTKGLLDLAMVATTKELVTNVTYHFTFSNRHIELQNLNFPVIALPNQQMLNVKTGEVFESTPEYVTTIKLPVSPKQMPTPVFDRMLAEIFEHDPDAKEVMYDLYSRMLVATPESTDQWDYFYGEGSNAKSTLMFVPSKILGDENVAFTNLEDLSSNFGLAELVDDAYIPKLVAFGQENSTVLKEATVTTLKQLTSGGKMKINQKYVKVESRALPTVLVQASNKLFRGFDSNPAFWRRVVFFKLRKVFEPAKTGEPSIMDRIEPELPGVLFNMIQRLPRLAKQHYRLIPTVGMEADKTEWRNQVESLEDPISQFFDAKLMIEAGQRVNMKDVESLFYKFVATLGLSVGELSVPAKFHKALKAEFLDRMDSELVVYRSNGTRFYMDLKFKEASEDAANDAANDASN